MRNRQSPRYQNNLNTPVQLHPLSIRTRARRPVRAYLGCTSITPLNLSLLLAFRSAYELQEPSSTFYTPQNVPTLLARLDKLTKDVKAELKSQGFEGNRIHVESMLNMRFDGTDTALMVLPMEQDGEGEDFERAFKRVYKSEFGFLLDTKSIIVDDIKVIFFYSSFCSGEQTTHIDCISLSFNRSAV